MTANVPSGRPKISIKWKLFVVVAVLISAAVIIIVTRTSSIFREDKEAFVKELSAKLASSTAKNFLNRVTTLQDKLIIFISSRESLAHTGARAEDQLQVLFSRYQEFISIGFLSPEDNGKLHVDWVMRNPQGTATRWPHDYEKNFLSNLNTKSAAARGRAFWRTQSPDGAWLSVLGFSVQVLDVKQAKQQSSKDKNLPPKNNSGGTKMAWIIGVLPDNAFDDLLNDFSTGLNTGYVVDDEGIAIADSDSDNRWKSQKNEPLVAEALKGDRPAETGDYKSSTGRAIIGSFESVPKMNLAVIVTTPRDKAFEAADTLSRDIFIIGFLILVTALAAAILLSNYLTGPLQKLAAIAAKIGSGDFKTPIDVYTNDEIGELAMSFKLMETGLSERDEKIASTQAALVQGEKMSAFGQLSAGIAHEVKNPLAGILGHAQLAIGKVKSDDVKKHLEVIEKETRRCKQIVENLMKFARAEKATLGPTDLAQACQDTINLVDHQLTLAGCKILKDFQPCPMVDANSNMLQQVLLNLMVNSSHAMETCPIKNVTVRVVQVGKKAQIQVEDTGTGIPPEVQKKMFEPFFTTKPAGKGTGLGLSVSIGIVKDHKGEIYIKSEMGKGTTFFMDFPIPEGAQMPSKPLENTHGGIAVNSPLAGNGSVADKKPDVKVAAPAPTKPEVKLETKTQTKAEIKPEVKIDSKATAQKVTASDTTPGAKIVNIKDGAKKAEIKETVFKKPASGDGTPPLPEDADSPGVPQLNKNAVTPATTEAKSKAAPVPAPIPKSTADATFAGKNPVDVTSVKLPEIPNDSDALTQAPTTNTVTSFGVPAENGGDLTFGAKIPPVPKNSEIEGAAFPSENKTEFKVVVKRPSTTATPHTEAAKTPGENTGASSADFGGEFKVKVKRPKLKG